jgi:hypothetical protein
MIYKIGILFAIIAGFLIGQQSDLQTGVLVAISLKLTILSIVAIDYMERK